MKQKRALGQELLVAIQDIKSGKGIRKTTATPVKVSLSRDFLCV